MNRFVPFIIVLLCSLALPANATTFKIATLSPDGSYWMKALRAGAAEITKKTDNRVKFKFYPGGVMGDDKAVLRKIRIKQLHGGAVTAGSLSNLYPDGQVYNLPMLFHDLDEISYVRNKVDPHIVTNIEKYGFVTFGLAEGGFAYIMSMHPIYDVEGLRKHRTWIPASDATATEVVKTYDVKPITLPLGDVLTGLQTGLIDTVASPPIGALALHWHTQIKYLTDMPLLYSYALLVIDQRSFKKLKAQDQKIVRQVMAKVFKEIDERNRKDNASAYAALKNQGIQFVSPSQNQLDEWRDYAKRARKQLLETGFISQSIMGEVDTLLNEYRNTH